MQPPRTVIDRRQILGTPDREGTRSRPRRPQDAGREREAVTLSGLYEELFLGRSHRPDQRSERIAESIQLLRIVLIHAGHVAAELRSAIPDGSTGVLAHPDIRAVERADDLTKNDRRRRVLELLKRPRAEATVHDAAGNAGSSGSSARTPAGASARMNAAMSRRSFARVSVARHTRAIVRPALASSSAR